MRFLWHWAILVLGLYIVTLITPISFDRPRDLVWAALLLIVANAVIRPFLILFTLPLVLLSLGLFLFVINALILYTVPHFVHGFHVPGFFSALIGSLLLSLLTAVFTGCEKRVAVRRGNASTRSGKVIDI